MAKRKYQQLTDEEILEMLRAGVVWVVGTEIYSRGRRLTEYMCRRRYRHVRIYKDNKRKSIAKHKLIWMATHNEVVPDGCEVHHKNGKTKEFAWDLEVLDRFAHLRHHHGDDVEYPSAWDEGF